MDIVIKVALATSLKQKMGYLITIYTLVYEVYVFIFETIKLGLIFIFQ